MAPFAIDIMNSPQPCIVTGNNDIFQSEIEHCSSVSQKPDGCVDVDNEKHVSVTIFAL